MESNAVGTAMDEQPGHALALAEFRRPAIEM